MSKGIAPSAPIQEFETNAFQSYPPPPSYDQVMTEPALIPHLQPQVHYPQNVPGSSMVPYSQSQLPYPTDVPPTSQLPHLKQPYQPHPIAPGSLPYPMPQPQQFGVPGEQPQPNLMPAQPIVQQNVLPSQPPQQTSVTAVFVNGPVAVGPKPCRLRCPMCHADIKTSTVTENQAGAHIGCIILCLLGCFLCSCIPYCMDSCKIVQHKCPVCKSYLGTYKG